MSNPAKKRKKLGSDEQHIFPKAKTPGKDLRLIVQCCAIDCLQQWTLERPS